MRSGKTYGVAGRLRGGKSSADEGKSGEVEELHCGRLVFGKMNRRFVDFGDMDLFDG